MTSDPGAARHPPSTPTGEDTLVKIAIPTQDYATISGHAGQARHWLVFDCQAGEPLPEPSRVELSKAQTIHHLKDDGLQRVDPFPKIHWEKLRSAMGRQRPAWEQYNSIIVASWRPFASPAAKDPT
jgi:hypothetical protein